MPAGSRHLIRVAAAVLLMALAAPAAALADGGSKCNASACKVYHEQNGPNTGHHQQQPQQPTSSNQGGSTKQSHAPKSYARVLQQAGKDRSALKNLLGQDGNIGSLSRGSGGGSPSLLGAAFDLGAGPTILLAILLGVGLGVAARGGAGNWLRRRSSS